MTSMMIILKFYLTLIWQYIFEFVVYIDMTSMMPPTKLPQPPSSSSRCQIKLKRKANETLEILTTSTIINNHQFAFHFKNFDKYVYEFVRIKSKRAKLSRCFFAKR